MIITYRDWNQYRGFAPYVNGAPPAQSGFLVKGRKGSKAILRGWDLNMQQAANADLTRIANIQLVTVDESGAISPAGPTVTPITMMFKLWANSATVARSFHDHRNDLRIEVPEGFGIGWYSQVGTIQAQAFIAPDLLSLRIWGHWEPCSSFNASNNYTLQPAGIGT